MGCPRSSPTALRNAERDAQQQMRPGHGLGPSHPVSDALCTHDQSRSRSQESASTPRRCARLRTGQSSKHADSPCMMAHHHPQKRKLVMSVNLCLVARCLRSQRRAARCQPMTTRQGSRCAGARQKQGLTTLHRIEIAQLIEKIHKETEAGGQKAGKQGNATLLCPPNGPPMSDWQEVVDPSTGTVYYYNPTTQETSWTNPAAPAAADSAWQEITDPSSGDKYYFNSITQETSWDRPASMGTAETPAPKAASAPTGPSPRTPAAGPSLLPARTVRTRAGFSCVLCAALVCAKSSEPREISHLYMCLMIFQWHLLCFRM